MGVRFVRILAAAGAILWGQVGFGQAALVDPFVPTIEAMKSSVARLVCLGPGADPVPDPRGSAFFVSSAGEFVTAAHVIQDMMEGPRACVLAAIVIPLERWQPEAPLERQAWFPFTWSDCTLEPTLDIARCNLQEDLSVRKSETGFKVEPVKFAWETPRDGTYVAFTGFPLGNRDPITARGTVATYRGTLREGKPAPEIVLDRSAWHFSSGSPVYTVDGRVVGIVIQGGTEDAGGMTIVRPAASIRALLAEERK
jgi:hypothetical protein